MLHHLCSVSDLHVCRYSTSNGAKKKKMTIRRRVRRKIAKNVFYAIYSQCLTYGENGFVNDKNLNYSLDLWIW
jgi:hypothetical protein